LEHHVTHTTTAADDLERRLAGFGRLGLLKLASALVTEDRGIALMVGTSMDPLPIDDTLCSDLVAGAMDSIASLATAMAIELRGEPALR
jgi:hypothetical protein